jgi:hypothetical protein
VSSPRIPIAVCVSIEGVLVKRGESYLLAEALDQLPGVLACEATTGGGD